MDVRSNRERSYRFFYHYNKQKESMIVHFKKRCITVSNIDCRVPCNTKWNKTQPMLVMQGFCKSVQIIGDKAVII